VLVARRGDRLEEVKAELEEKFGARVESLVADLTDENDLASVEARIASEERLGMLVNNAGFGLGPGPFWEQPKDGHERMYKLHVTATMRLTHAALGNLVVRGEGSVINVASVAGFLMRSGSVSYSVTKEWMITFTRALALDLQAAGSRVQVQALCPGFTYTEFHDVLGMDRKKMAGEKLWMSASDVVEASLEGLSGKKLIVVPGWRYKALVGVLGSLPKGMSQVLISAASKKR
jgi:short-subunit dehydrogenase